MGELRMRLRRTNSTSRAEDIGTEGGSDRLDGDTAVPPEPQQRRVPHALPHSLHKRSGSSYSSPGETHCQGSLALEVWNVPPHVEPVPDAGHPYRGDQR